MNVRRAFEKNRIVNPLFIAGDGIEALEILRGGLVPAARRIVLLDLNMPRMTGIEFLRELRKDPMFMHTPVVVVTSSIKDRDKIEQHNRELAGYLDTPL